MPKYNRVNVPRMNYDSFTEHNGGFMLPYEFAKDLMRHMDFLRYWQWEKDDLTALRKRLEKAVIRL